ncbi:MAG TPA: UDP-3-O-(3-hydroxymyristoyl)glucosamine N-acyltransferase [Gammaproteobacteria bacterium]|nr:UDP-3-O-(3-hydroxymyristoyl)glucosamine N-acyltransferase [Gammaproteobacteria bacterium]
MSATLDELASRYGCRVQGSGATRVSRVATLDSATPDAISFLANPLYRSRLKTTGAGAVILDSASSPDCPVPCLIAANPYAVYAQVACELHPAVSPGAGIHPDASVAPTASVAAGAFIGPRAVVGAGATIGDGAVVGAGAVIGERVSIGGQTRIAPLVSVLDGVTIGARCIVHSGAVIGADGFGFAEDDGRWIKVPQIGSVVVGDDVEIGANTTIDRGSIEDTVIEDGVKLDNLVQIAHNVCVGAHTVMAAMSGAAGSTKIGKRCKVGGGVAIVGHLSICDDVMFTFRSVVTKSVTEPGIYGGSLQAREASKWRRSAARFKQLDEMHDSLKRLERRFERLAGKTPDND